MRTNKNKWLSAEIQVLKDNPDMSPRELVSSLLLPGRTKAAITYKRCEIGIVTNKHMGRGPRGTRSENGIMTGNWSSREISYFTKNINKSDEFVAKTLSRSPQDVLSMRGRVKSGEITVKTMPTAQFMVMNCSIRGRQFAVSNQMTLNKLMAENKLVEGDIVYEMKPKFRVKPVTQVKLSKI